MKLIVGLGNPDKKYANTRHNLGFMIVDAFVKEEGISWRYSQDWMGYFAKTNDYVLVKPTVYMNKSGQSIAAIFNFYNIGIEDVLVIHDELDLPFGKIRISVGGTAAGHKGVESVIASLAGPDFARLRVGVGHAQNKDAESYVLEEFSPEESAKLGEIIKVAQSAIKSFLEEGILAAMNKFN